MKPQQELDWIVRKYIRHVKRRRRIIGNLILLTMVSWPHFVWCYAISKLVEP